MVSPEVHADGRITFRLCAPKAEKVSVICEAVGAQPMAKNAGGVWSLTVGPVPPGIYDTLSTWTALRITDPASPNVFGNRQGLARVTSKSRSGRATRGPTSGGNVPHGTVTIHWYTSKATGSRRRVHVYAPRLPARDRETLSGALFAPWLRG